MLKPTEHKIAHKTKILKNIGISCFKAAMSVTFELLILEKMFQFFKNTVKN